MLIPMCAVETLKQSVRMESIVHWLGTPPDPTQPPIRISKIDSFTKRCEYMLPSSGLKNVG